MQHRTLGRDLAEEMNPGVHEALSARYHHILPGMADTLTSFVYGEFYARPGLDLKTRLVATIAGLTALGGQTATQLKIHIASALKAGLSRTEIAEVIWQMALYGGFPAAINALNAALEVFADEEGETS